MPARLRGMNQTTFDPTVAKPRQGYTQDAGMDWDENPDGGGQPDFKLPTPTGNTGWGGGSNSDGELKEDPPQQQGGGQNSYTIHGYRPADLNDPNDAWNAFLTTGTFAVPKNLEEAQGLQNQFNEWGKTNGGWTATAGGHGDKWSFLNKNGVSDSADVITDIGGPTSGFWYGDSRNFPGGGFQSGPEAPGGGGGAGTGGGAGGGGGFNGDALRTALQGLFPNGAFNQDVVNRRSENAASTLRRYSNSQRANNRARLADRGLIGSGPEATEAYNRESDIADQYAEAVSGIYADESQNADSRMIQALSLAAGLDQADADRLLGYFKANNDFSLGQGGLALGNFKAQNDYNLGLGNFGLQRDQLEYDMSHGDIDQMIELLGLLMGGAQTSSGGHF
jgi:hypothetical protein